MKEKHEVKKKREINMKSWKEVEDIEEKKER